MELPKNGLVVNVECKNFNKALRQIDRLTKSFNELAIATMKAAEATKALKAVLPIELESDVDGGACND